MQHPEVEAVFTTAVMLGEVQEYLSRLARKKRLPVDTVLLAAASLPGTVVERVERGRHFDAARSRG